MSRKAVTKIIVFVGSSNVLLEESAFLIDTKTMCEFVQSAFMNLLCPLAGCANSTAPCVTCVILGLSANQCLYFEDFCGLIHEIS
jgi:hypothetical protein